MAISQALCTSFKVELLTGHHAFGSSVVRAGTTTDTFKVALYTSSATLGAATTDYANNTGNEVANGNGYTTGGTSIAIAQAPTSTSATAWLDFTDTQWTTATFTARGGLIYNDTNSDKAVAVLDFGTDKTVDNGTFTIQWPVGDSSTAIIRIV